MEIYLMYFIERWMDRVIGLLTVDCMCLWVWYLASCWFCWVYVYCIYIYVYVFSSLYALIIKCVLMFFVFLLLVWMGVSCIGRFDW